uniref:Syntaxin 6/10/61 N-terminal domain-containing protein n=1 Tax=Emiliania huxleyi TaxID=2903 RepID=A0A7S3S6V9_EMIHU
MDPYTAVRDEVEHSVTVVTQLHSKWNELKGAARKSDEFEWTSSELLSGLRSIEWDLQDLEDTISIVETSPQKFQISEGEVAARRSFIDSTRSRITAMRDEVQGQAQAEAGGAGYSTKSAGGGLPSVNKAKGYGKVGGSDDAVEVAVQPMASAVDDEILGADLHRTPEEGGRHRRKKLCVALLVLLLAGAGLRTALGGAAAATPTPDAAAAAAAAGSGGAGGGGEEAAATGGGDSDSDAGADAGAGANATRRLLGDAWRADEQWRGPARE